MLIDLIAFQFNANTIIFFTRVRARSLKNTRLLPKCLSTVLHYNAKNVFEIQTVQVIYEHFANNKPTRKKTHTKKKRFKVAELIVNRLSLNELHFSVVCLLSQRKLDTSSNGSQNHFNLHNAYHFCPAKIPNGLSFLIIAINEVIIQ